MDKDIDLRRRRLLASTGALAAAGFGGASQVAAQTASAPAAPQAKTLPPYVAWKQADALIIHSPTTIETKRSAFGASLITPSDRLFIRNNLAAPDVSIVANPDAWSIAIEGVKQPRTLTVAELKTLGLDALPMVLQCSGNGRGLFDQKASGTQWRVGAAGLVIWGGVPLRAVAEALGGVAPGMRFVTGTGGETIPAGVDPKSVIVERSVPISVLDDAMLAWEMNGEPVPHAHGGPLRLIIPGYSGVNNVKYVKRLAFTRDETDASDPEQSVSDRAARWQGEPEPAARLGDGCEVVGQFSVAGEWTDPRGLGADTRGCVRRHERCAAGRGLGGRRQIVARRGVLRAEHGPVRMAAVRSADAASPRQAHDHVARDRYAGQCSGRDDAVQLERISQRRLARPYGGDRGRLTNHVGRPGRRTCWCGPGLSFL
jgi:DMSO/TMAO reductase YedYZ molybdopterin-dependent catalytic subunit